MTVTDPKPNSLTKREKEEKSKKEFQEDQEYLRQVEAPTGPDYIAQIEGNKIKQEQRKKESVFNTLDLRKGRRSYRITLRNYGNQLILDDPDLQNGWRAYFIDTDAGESLNIDGKNFDRLKEGLVLVAKAPNNKSFCRAVQTIYDPPMDVNAIHICLQQLENTIDAEKGILLDKTDGKSLDYKQTTSGLYIPK